MCIQCVQIAPSIIVPKRPTYRPAFLNASGIANMPVPMLPVAKKISWCRRNQIESTRQIYLSIDGLVCLNLMLDVPNYDAVRDYKNDPIH